MLYLFFFTSDEHTNTKQTNYFTYYCTNTLCCKKCTHGNMTDVLYFLKYRLTKKLLLLISAVTVIEIGTTTILAKPSTSKITIFGT